MGGGGGGGGGGLSLGCHCGVTYQILGLYVNPFSDKEFLQNWKLLEISQQKFQHFYNLGRNEFSPNLKGVAQKMDPLRPFEVLDIFGGKSKSKAPKAFKFSTKQVTIKVNNW